MLGSPGAHPLPLAQHIWPPGTTLETAAAAPVLGGAGTGGGIDPPAASAHPPACDVIRRLTTTAAMSVWPTRFHRRCGVYDEPFCPLEFDMACPHIPLRSAFARRPDAASASASLTHDTTFVLG